MCGIAGQYCFKGKPNKEIILKMSDILKHRGPDADGSYFDDKVGLAHRRLSIIDLSDDAKQPMFNEDKSIVLIYNGEIYNFEFLKGLLEKNGHKFTSHSDSEVIIHAYEEWGLECLHKFEGMWAFVLYDIKNNKMICVRDRFGIKPFYYTFVDHSLLFASEIKALLAHPKVGKTPNAIMVNTFLSTGIMDNSSMTMFSGVHQLQPSHGLIISIDGLRQFKYYDVDVSPNIKSSIPDDNIATNLRSLLDYSVQHQLRSDVPVGTCLSGGIDSSTIVKLIKTDEEQNTFSACFPYSVYDESYYINKVVKDTSINSFKVEPSSQDLLRDIDNLIYIQDEPFGSLSIYAQYCVMKLAQGKVKVLLDGQGADELFGGYLAYQKSYIKELFHRNYFILCMKELFWSLRCHSQFYHYAVNQVKARNNRKDLLKNYSYFSRYEGKFDKMLKDELFSTNLQSLLHFEDRNSMAFSIESRVPYLDSGVVNYVSSLPYNQKIRDGTTKFALRNAAKGLIPEEVRGRMDKMGFVTPEELWMKYYLNKFIFDILKSESFKKRSFWYADRVLKDYEKFVSGKSHYSPEIWRIVCTELWLKKFFDNRVTLFDR